MKCSSERWFQIRFYFNNQAIFVFVKILHDHLITYTIDTNRMQLLGQFSTNSMNVIMSLYGSWNLQCKYKSADWILDFEVLSLESTKYT